MMVDKLFSWTDRLIILAGIVLIGLGLVCMYFDPKPYGFGLLTLSVAPFILLAGTSTIALGIFGWQNLQCSWYGFLRTFWSKLHLMIWSMVVFMVALVMYVITLEPTASLWDCSEFIAAAYKLQVAHTPGAPLFILIGRVFTMFSLGNEQLVAWCMNFMSALTSAGAVFFMFHIIRYFGNRTIGNNGPRNAFPVMIAAASGSLSMALCDTFWFSAVEAETYAFASCSILTLIYLALRWYEVKDNKLAKRMLILLFYLLSLAYCIHPMCLLVLPAIILFKWMKGKHINSKNVILGSFLGFITLFMLNRWLATGVFEALFHLDKFLVNGLSWPFYSGGIFFIILIVAIYYAVWRYFPRYKLIYLVIAFAILGLWPYLMLMARSAKNPPIDEGNPENLASLTTYIKRESYGSRPLVYGRYFDADVVDVENSGKAWYKSDDGYEVAGNKLTYKYDESRETILPRMYSADEKHIALYRSWSGLQAGEKPHFRHNLAFLVRYQLGHMWFRYLMWNFSGRASDVQDAAWLAPIDGWNAKPQAIKNNKARNQYWMIPLVLGIMGFIFQLRRDKQGGLFTALTFLTFGIILSLYLNAPPGEPRERDYIYVGSVMTFCVWIGLGVLSAWTFLLNTNLHTTLKQVIIGLIALLPVGILLVENFDDHDRSGRTLHMDYARNILQSCAPNAILFTGGDNDTFPLWYLQEVEGVRTDVRVIVLSYFNSDWNIAQNKAKHYASEPLPISLVSHHYRQYGPNDVIYINNSGDKEAFVMEVGKVLDLIKAEHPALRAQSKSGDYYHQLPSNLVSLKVNAGELNHLNLPDYLQEKLVSKMMLNIKGRYLEKNGLMFLDMLVNNKWQRPIYFNFTSLNSIGIDVSPYVVQEGFLFRLLPLRNKSGKPMLNRGLMYNNLIEKAVYADLSDDDNYFTHEDYYLRIILPIRQSFVMLALDYLNNDEMDKAAEVAQFAYAHLYPEHIPVSALSKNLASILRVTNAPDLSNSLAERYFSQEHDAVDD